jgi:hypothetical protein
MKIPKIDEVLDQYDGLELIHTRISEQYEQYYCHWIDVPYVWAMVEISNTNLDLVKKGLKDIRSLFDESHVLHFLLIENPNTGEEVVKTANLDDIKYIYDNLPKYGVFLNP